MSTMEKEKIVVRFAHTIYPNSFAFFTYFLNNFLNLGSNFHGGQSLLAQGLRQQTDRLKDIEAFGF
jgi:hypothetical protein